VAQRLPQDQVEYYLGRVFLARKTGRIRNGLSIVETVRRNEKCGSWMVMKNLEVDPDYGALMRMLVQQVYAQYDVRSSGTG
jgi:hypothetical protein